jgi:hypothetical protein
MATRVKRGGGPSLVRIEREHLCASNVNTKSADKSFEGPSKHVLMSLTCRRVVQNMIHVAMCSRGYSSSGAFKLARSKHTVVTVTHTEAHNQTSRKMKSSWFGARVAGGPFAVGYLVKTEECLHRWAVDHPRHPPGRAAKLSRSRPVAHSGAVLPVILVLIEQGRPSRVPQRCHAPRGQAPVGVFSRRGAGPAAAPGPEAG